MNQRIIVITFIIIALIVTGVFVFWYKTQAPSGEKVYTRADFPNVSKDFTPERLQQIIDKLNSHYKNLESRDVNINIFGTWIEIGILKKTLSDFLGAEEAWQNALVLDSGDSVVLGDLADLYLYILKQPQKAEEYFKRALASDPINYTYYEGLATLYRYNMPEKKNLVETVMSDGAKNDPERTINYYLYLVDFFFKEGNDLKKMKEYINKAKELNPKDSYLENIKDYEKDLAERLKNEK